MNEETFEGQVSSKSNSDHTFEGQVTNLASLKPIKRTKRKQKTKANLINGLINITKASESKKRTRTTLDFKQYEKLSM